LAMRRIRRRCFAPIPCPSFHPISRSNRTPAVARRPPSHPCIHTQRFALRGRTATGSRWHARPARGGTMQGGMGTGHRRGPSARPR
jgi:hypothetical protein